MTELVRPIALPPKPGTTQAADGLPRRKWTAEEIERMLEAGIIEHGERFELIGGELVAMAAKGRQHEFLKIELCAYWMKIRPPDLMVAPETALRLGPHDEPEPEFIVYPRSILPHDVRGDTVLLVVEIADSSLRRDRTIKAQTYAAFGVREYWVINARSRVTTVHRDPGPTGYASITEHGAEEWLTPLLAPALAVRLADFA
jgi:Uma2 family endonuclease